MKPASTSATGSINVIADSGCPWTATKTDSWITITSGSNGTANGTVGYSIAANASANPRIGIITIAGQPFTVTQFGAGRRRSAGR